MVGMLIDSEFIRFCAVKTREVVTEYEAAYPEDAKNFWRSTEGLDQIMMGRCAVPIYQRQLKRLWTDRALKVRSLYVPYSDRVEIYYAAGLPTDYLRYFKTKELLQIHLWQESLVTRDIIDLVQNMILRESPTGVDLNLTHPATSETLGEIAAMEFLFPLSHRLPFVSEKDGVAKLAEAYQIPPFVVQRCLSYTEVLKPFFV